MIQAVKNCCLFIFLGFSTCYTSAQVSFCAVGDILLDRNVRTVIEENGIEYPFKEIVDVVNKNDLAFFNLECPLVNKEDGYPINKKYSFRANLEYVAGLKYAGFNIASVANNHTIDYGKSGFLKTIENLNSNSILTAGGGQNQNEAFKPLLIEKNGETFAFFAILEFLLEGTTFNDSQPYPAFGQIERLCDSIRQLNSDIDNIIVSFHWGQEGSIIPTTKQIELAHMVVDAGADLVLGHHPHVLQSIETYKGKLILYSLGNFIFDNTDQLQNESVIFSCSFNNGQLINPRLTPIHIRNCQPALASKEISKNIFNHLIKVSNHFNTFLTLNEESIEINYNYEKPMKELRTKNSCFYLYSDKIVTYNSFNDKIQYDLPDSNFIIIDGDLLQKDNKLFIYSIVQNKNDTKSRIAVFPFSKESNEFLRPSLDIHDDYNPWKIKVFDVDRDNIPEIVVGVNKATRYYAKKERRVFVFNVDGDYFYPKWLGSKIGNPIIDFKVCNSANKLVILEESNSKNSNMVVSYKWNGFGFDYDKILYENEPSRGFRLMDYQFVNGL